jgi:VIT1/CCC1 family predicted Fe2+/Mn2+ transporter
MNHSFKTGFSFGITSGIITTLGLMVGLHSGTHSKVAVIGGVLTIAIADSFSDAMGIHMSEEAENIHTPREIWESTIATFLSKFVMASSFIIPLLLWRLSTAIVIDAVWGLSMLSVFSILIARQQETKAWKVVLEHLAIALVVIGITHFAGGLISSRFG